MLNTILFDLDGTLLPMDDQHFLRLYLGLMHDFMNKNGYNGSKITKAVMQSTLAMTDNQGMMTNEEAFWIRFKSLFPEVDDALIKAFDQFYLDHFDEVKASTTCHSLARPLIKELKAKGYTLVLATNPLFPPIATKKRIGWANLDVNDFEIITTFDNSSYTKPKLAYYEAILKQLRKKPENCLMIGNDAHEDMIASQLGIKTYLVTDCLINSKGIDLVHIPHGSFQEMITLVQSLPKLNY